MKKLMLFGVCASLLMGLGVSQSAFAWGYYHRGWGGPRVVVGVGPYWGPDPYYWGPPRYVGPPPVVYVTPPAPRVYVEKPTPVVSYYCRSPEGYYPQVPRCPSGWLKVAPH
ncbi:hypothetical protein GA565_12855 [Rouxiella sp. S1S-2]|uniref:hypothetical protein n=1 Tax=Rouxiella sp. S1S-2 TaxID=2653856 RepID=UPI00126502B0|nr:hypothetical protein [Rouxiella sp. S1S-2]KAB7896792.1 hypothetical protein GA565_12855 [Rouxiella sp. S1S-2]